MKIMILLFTLLFSLTPGAQEEKRPTPAELIKKIQANDKKKPTPAELIIEIQSKDKKRPTPAELIKQIQARDNSTLAGCEMSSDGKEIICGDKIYEISGKVNELERIHHKLDKMNNESVPAAKSLATPQ